MSCCGARTRHEELRRGLAPRLAKLAAFLRTLRDNGFAVGLAEGQDAASLMAAGYAARPGLLRSAFKHLFSARKSDWEKFDGLFDAFWLGKRVRSRVDDVRARRKAANNPSLKNLRTVGQRTPADDARWIRSRPLTRAATIAAAKAAWKAPRAPTIWPRCDFRKLADPEQIAAGARSRRAAGARRCARG